MNGPHDTIHWDDETVFFAMRPTVVVGEGTVHIAEGLDQRGNSVRFIEVWDGIDVLDAPIGSAGIKPVNVLTSKQLPLARWTLTFADDHVHLSATALPAPASWSEED